MGLVSLTPDEDKHKNGSRGMNLLFQDRQGGAYTTTP
jgi:hypothetical protein